MEMYPMVRSRNSTPMAISNTGPNSERGRLYWLYGLGAIGVVVLMSSPANRHYWNAWAPVHRPANDSWQAAPAFLPEAFLMEPCPMEPYLVAASQPASSSSLELPYTAAHGLPWTRLVTGRRTSLAR